MMVEMDRNQAAIVSSSQSSAVSENRVTSDVQSKTKYGKKWPGYILAGCIILVLFWEVMSGLSRRPWKHFQLTAEDFAGFRPVSPEWTISALPVSRSYTEPNILAFEMVPVGGLEHTGKVVTRLVHGYNMCDCMRIKGYKVELIEDRVRAMEGKQDSRNRGQVPGEEGQESGVRSQESGVRVSAEGGFASGAQVSHAPSGRMQIWRLTSGAGDVSAWVTGMVRAGDFSETDIDVRDMPFPRVGIPDDPNWVPRGMTWESLKHPIAGFRKFMNLKWNNSRCDVWVFLGLKQPPWASTELLTLVSAWTGPSLKREEEAGAVKKASDGYFLILDELRKWKRTQAE